MKRIKTIISKMVSKLYHNLKLIINIVLIIGIFLMLFLGYFPITKDADAFGGGPVWVANFDAMGNIEKVLKEKIVGKRLDKNIFQVTDMKNGLFDYWKQYLKRIDDLGSLSNINPSDIFSNFDNGNLLKYNPINVKDKTQGIFSEKNTWEEYVTNDDNMVSPDIFTAEKDPEAYTKMVSKTNKAQAWRGEMGSVNSLPDNVMGQQEKRYWQRKYNYYHLNQQVVTNMVAAGGAGVNRAVIIEKQLKEQILPSINQSLNSSNYNSFQAQKDLVRLQTYQIMILTEILKQLSDMKVGIGTVAADQQRRLIAETNRKVAEKVIKSTTNDVMSKHLKEYYKNEK